MVIKFIVAFSQIIFSAKYIYSTKDEAVTKLEYEKLYVMDQHKDPFIKACNNGECDILNLDGSRTGISKLPVSLQIMRAFRNQNLFITEANRISTFFFEGKRIDIPQPFLQPKVMIGNSKICKDSSIIVPQTNKKSKQPNRLSTSSQVTHTACYDLITNKIIVLPYRFTSSLFGMGIFNGDYSSNGYGYIYSNGKIYDSLKNCDETKFLDGTAGIQCSSPKPNAAPWNDVTFDSEGNRLPSDFGSIYNKYFGLTFSIKRDEFGTDSTIISQNGSRINGHAFFKPIPFYNAQGYCMTDFNSRQTNCYSINQKKGFKIEFGVYGFLAISGVNASDTLGFDSEYRLNIFPDRFFQKTRFYSGVWHVSDHGFIVSSGGNTYNANPGLIAIKIDQADSFVVHKFIQKESGGIERVGKFFIVGVD